VLEVGYGVTNAGASALSVSSANKRSTRLIHDYEVGVKCTLDRGCFCRAGQPALVLVGGVVVADQVRKPHVLSRDLAGDGAQNFRNR